jgi:HD-like signal output (HDOD) protein
MEDKLRAAVQAIQGVKIPDLPKEILELDAVLASKFPNFQDITRIIESNVKLSGEVMRLVNSPVMKLKVPVKSIREAVDVLGLINLKNLVVAAALNNLFNGRQFEEIVEHSKDVAFCCAELSEHLEGVSRDEAYLLGLFHNAGCLLLASKDPQNYPKVFLKVHANPIRGVAAETKFYGSNHGDIGLLIGKKWQLPVEMLNVIMLHHRSPEVIANDKMRGMASMVQVANSIVNEVSYGTYVTEEARQYLAQAKEDLMIGNDVIDTVRKSLIVFST